MLKKSTPVTDISELRKSFLKDDALVCKSLMLSNTALDNAAFDPIASGKMDFKFSKEIKTLEVTNQKASGRCWLFAALNFLREKTAAKLNVENIEFSQNYVAFFDKLEKINYFLESIIDTADREITDRTVSFILETGIADGGQWDMLVSLINKYGIVPKAAMPETYMSSNTGLMNRMINMKLREMAAQLRNAYRSGEDVSKIKEEMLSKMYESLVICFGMPPDSFDFEYTDKDDNYHIERHLDPKSFYDKYVGVDLSEYVSIINAPTSDKPFYSTFTVKYLGNVVENDNIRYLNVPMDILKDLIIKQLNDDEVVWFGSDVGKFGERKEGIWDIDSFGYDKILGYPLSISKEDQLDYRDSAMTHAMLITGYNMGEDGSPDRWKIENSWGDERGKKGYYIIGKKWFDQYVYQAVINKKHLSDDLLEDLQKKPIELDPWDPMGSLAK